MLTVTYTVPAAPVPPVISGVTVAAGKLDFDFSAEANHTYAVEFTDRLSPANWSTLTNYSASPIATNFVASDPFTSSNRFYRVRTP